MSEKPSTYTGRGARRKTRKSVKVADLCARSMITIGGIGTIFAVAGVCLFLVSVVVPLFMPAHAQTPVPSTMAIEQTPLFVAGDEYRLMGYALAADGTLTVFRIDNGKVLEQRAIVESDVAITSHSFVREKQSIALGFADGSVRIGRVRFATTFLPADEVPQSLRDMTVDQPREHAGGMVQLTSEGQYRLQQFVVEMDDPIATGSDQPIVLLDHYNDHHLVFSALSRDDQLSIYSVRSRKNLMTGKVTYRASRGAMPYEARAGARPLALKIAGLGNQVFLVYEDGHLVRYDTRHFDAVQVAETIELFDSYEAAAEPGAKVTAVDFILGRSTLLVGDNHGRASAWFGVKPDSVGLTEDGRSLVDKRKLPADLASRMQPVGENLVLPQRVAKYYSRNNLLLDTQVDAVYLVKAHELVPGDAAVTSLSASTRTRMAVIGYADGQVKLHHVTTSSELLATTLEGDHAVEAVAISPKDDGLVALAGPNVAAWTMDVGFPEITLSSLFARQWYEGYPRPTFTWQSSSGDDAFEPKFGLVPLIFGTLKATVYSMLFAVPLALLAAIYTSEFLHPKVKARVKPTVEMMASLPSVVLGFFAGLVIAPFVEGVVPALIAGLVTVPVAFMLGAYGWQMMPRTWQIYLQNIGVDNTGGVDGGAGAMSFISVLHRVLFFLGGVRLIMLVVMLAVGIAMAAVIGPAVETMLFAGDIMRWLNGQIGSGLGGWFVLLIPISAIGASLVITRLVNPYIREIGDDWSHRKAATIALIKYVGGCLLAVVIALCLAGLLTIMGMDPRRPMGFWGLDLSMMGTYVNRNALIVGFAMGFAVIPIIYTIAEDALSAVPEHLRSASLGAGATPWQTATRIIMPTAMSGLFSAIMIGLGRAVGETMIVLMALGNTPITEANIFNGARTLAANIAVELPEAPRDAALYRTLFLTALVLFAMTFAINTVAEAVRLRFRRRAVSL